MRPGSYPRGQLNIAPMLVMPMIVVVVVIVGAIDTNIMAHAADDDDHGHDDCRRNTGLADKVTQLMRE